MKPLKNIKVISFDMDGTLLHEELDRRLWMVWFMREVSKVKNMPLKKAKEFVHKEYRKELSKNSPDWVSLKFWFRKFGIHKDPSEPFKKYIHLNRPYKDAEIIEYLKDRYRLVITTNASEEFLNAKLSKKMADRFEKIYSIPRDFRKLKKDSQIFRHIIKDLKVKPDEVLHIGNDLDFDYHEPKNLGINVLYLNRKKQPNPKDIDTIRTLKTLKKLLID